MKLPESSGAELCTVDDVLITDELARRPSRPPDYAAENEALVALARELTTDPAGVLQKVAELVVLLCRADSAGISVLERVGDEEIFRWHAAAGRFAPNLWGTMPRSASPCGTVITRNSVLLFTEAERFFPALRGVEPRIYENLLAPWEAGGKVTGTVWAIGHSPEHHFDAEDARLLQSLACFAGAAYGLLERTRAAEGLRSERLAALNLMEDAVIARRETERADAALRESEENYRTLFNSMDQGYILVDVIFDEDGKPVDIVYREANPAAVRMTGTELVGRRAREVAPDTEPYWFETFGRVAKTGVGERHEFQFAPLGVWYDFYVFKVGAPGGPRVAAVYTDVTERRRAEERLRGAAELDAFRVALADALRPLNDPVQIQGEACRLLGEHLGAERAHYCEINEAENYIRINQDYVRGGAPSLVGVYELSAYGWIVPIYRRGDAINLADMENSELVSETGREAMSAVGIVAFAAIPLVKAGVLAGALVVAESAPREWSETEIELVRETAERIWAAVERARAEEALRRSRERMQRVLDTEAVGVIFFDHAGTVIGANEAFLEMTGYTSADVESGELSWRRMTPLEWIAESEAQIEKMAATGRIGPYEKQYILKDGSRRWMLFAGRDLGDGTISEYCIDINDRKRAEDALRRSEQRVRSVVEGVADYAIITQDTEGRVESWNPGAERMFGYAAEEMIGRGVEVLFTPEDRAAGAHLEEMWTARREGRASDERWLVRKDGSLFFASGVMSPLGDMTPTGYVKIARDLTRQKEAEDALRRAYDELEGRVRDRTMELAEANLTLQWEVRERRAAEGQIKHLLRQLVTAQEDERRRIARDIHDHLGQQMTGLRLSLELLRKQCADDSELCSRIEQTQGVAQKLDEDVDFIAWELRPAALDDLGLTPAFATFVNDWSKHFGLDAEFHASGVDGIRLALDVEINLYRILQEALNNVAKHADAAGVVVLLERKGDEIVLIVEDDGRGFDPEAKMHAGGRGEGLGLVGIRERAQLAGGSAEIESAAGGGTTVIVRVPFVRAEEGGARG